MHHGTALHNLAATYRALSKFADRLPNLRQAEETYKQALTVRTKIAAPIEYALTQNNLGNLYQELANATHQSQYLVKAVEAFDEALSVYTVSEFPEQYAQARYNQGIVFLDLGDPTTALTCWCDAERVYRQQGNQKMVETCTTSIIEIL